MNIESMISPASSDDLRLEHDGLAALGDQLHLDVARAVQRHRLLAVVEVAVRACATTCVREACAPLAHAVRVLAGVFLHRLRRAAVGVAFAQHRVDRAAEAPWRSARGSPFPRRSSGPRGSRGSCSPCPAVP